MRPRTLLFIVLLAIGVFYAYRYSKTLSDVPFQAELINLDTTDINSITISSDKENLVLTREPVGWIASNGQISTKSLSQPVSNILNQIYSVVIDKVITKNSEEWKVLNQKISEELNFKVYVTATEPEKFSLIKTDDTNNYQYISLSNQDEVYKIQGSGISPILISLNHYRPKRFLQLSDERKIESIQLYKLDSIWYDLKKDKSNWNLNEVLRIDSNQIGKYINTIKNLTPDKFADDFDELQIRQLPQQLLHIQFFQPKDSILIHCYQDTFRSNPVFILKSNQNEAFFQSDSSGIFQDLFLQFEKLFLE